LFKKVKEVARKRVAVVDWLLFAGTVFFIYGRLAISRFHLQYSPNPLIASFAQRHAFITLCFYITAFLVFVWSLEQRLYKYQFVQLCWTLLILHFTVFQSSFYLNLIFDGLIWFFIPTMMVVGNDIFAFVFGYFFGRTPLIQLSPRKTWEGFAGGMAMTLFFSVLFSSYLSSYPWMICPKTDLFTWGVQCTPAPAFLWTTYQLPALVAKIVSVFGHSGVVHYMPIQVHGVVFALFASLIAPFGGFFASGFKRAIKIKDFGNTIPGHGGITDRMDCQMLMGVFAYVYCITFVHPTGYATLTRSLMALPVQQQQELYLKLHKVLEGLNQLPA
jgi:phosphatidate cytidylyltransferase